MVLFNTTGLRGILSDSRIGEWLETELYLSPRLCVCPIGIELVFVEVSS